MPISINGTGSITGLSAGGLPDASVTADDIASNAVTTAKVNDAAITYGKLSTSATEGDNVAKRTAKAWVNFNGTGTVAIRDDFNVSSITDKGAGNYAINFTQSFSNANYSAVFTVANGSGVGNYLGSINNQDSAYCDVLCGSSFTVLSDNALICAVFIA